MNSNKKVSKIRMMASVMLGAIGLSLVASLVPAVASAEPYDPRAGRCTRSATTPATSSTRLGRCTTPCAP